MLRGHLYYNKSEVLVREWGYIVLRIKLRAEVGDVLHKSRYLPCLTATYFLKLKTKTSKIKQLPKSCCVILFKYLMVIICPKFRSKLLT